MTKKTTVTTTLRIPETLYNEVKKLAKKDNRSINYTLISLIKCPLEKKKEK